MFLCSNLLVQVLKINFVLEVGHSHSVFNVPNNCGDLIFLNSSDTHLKSYFLWYLFLKALKTQYFSNRPGPTPGCQLPRPNCPLETLKEQSNPAVATKRKRTQALEQGKTFIFVRNEMDSENAKEVMYS